MAKGSLSVFFSMIIAMVMTLILTMAECVRLYELHSFSQEYTDMAVESAFSEYNPYLWSNYKILAIDLGYGTESIGSGILESKTVDYCKYNASIDGGFNYARLSPQGCNAKYALLTDNQGQGVVILGEKAAMDGMASQVIDGIKGQIDAMNNIEKVEVEKKADTGKSTLEKAKKDQEDKKHKAATDNNPETNPADYEEPGSVEDNPLDAFSRIRESFSRGILGTVTKEDGISDASVELGTLPSHRTLKQGTLSVSGGGDVVEKALFIDYLMTNYSYYCKDLKHDGLKYELEYIIAGKESDVQSLATVVEEILLLREAANFTTIMKNEAMKAEAMAIAEVLAGFTMNPAIVEAIKYAIIAAWAYVESTLDIRLLLSGGKVPLIKNLDQWTSDVWHLSSVGDVNFKAKDSKTGVSYKQYLMSFLALNTNETLAIRACDVMEDALMQTEDYKNVRMDNMAFAADFSIDYSGEEMFLSMLTPQEESGYYFTKRKCISY